MRLFGKRLYPTESVKYVGVKIVISQKNAVRIINFQQGIPIPVPYSNKSSS